MLLVLDLLIMIHGVHNIVKEPSMKEPRFLQATSFSLGTFFYEGKIFFTIIYFLIFNLYLNSIYNKENPKDHYKYSYSQLLNLTFKEFISEFILFFCNYKKDTIKYVEEVDYITNTLNNFITLFRRKPINKIHKFNKLYYYGNTNINTNTNTMTTFDMSTKKFIITPCPKYVISINKNSEKKLIEIVINDYE